MSNRTVRMEEMTWVEYAQRIEQEQPVVMFPVGSLEQHGPHLPMHCDEAIPRRLSEMIAQNVPAMVAPSMCYGYKSQPRSGGGNHFPGTTSLDAETVIHHVRDVLIDLARHGVRRVAIMDGHYENTMFIIEGIDLALRHLRHEGVKDMKVLRISYFEFTTKEIEAKVWPEGFPSWPLEHAGVMETSVMLHLFPDLVHMEHVPKHGPAEFEPYDIYPVTAENLPGLPETGALISASSATAGKGELLVDRFVEGISDALVDQFGVKMRR